MNQLIRVLVVDDSAFVRKFVREMLSGSPYIEVVGVARDGNEALEMVEQLRPDVVTCDLIMPGRDGVGFVREQMKRRPLPILILTSAPEDGERALEAMEAGAVDFLQKPTALATKQILSIREELVEKVKAAARVPLQRAALPIALVQRSANYNARQGKVDIVVLGISTGGPQALRRMVAALPEDFPVPFAVVLHMPIGYTTLFAKKLDECSRLEVVEAKEGDLLQPGRLTLAAAGWHLVLKRRPDGQVAAHLAATPTDTPHRPAVDVLFRSAADVYHEKVLGVVMTGMGSDGREGAAWVKARGGTILTESEESCVIYGMPRTVVEAGLSDKAVPLNEMVQAIVDSL